ncbi:MAG TPA: helix-turn-helix transcriptional regulator, partial [Armatimonadota bacterium]|nr:helix-turn-helix transcriptional regulator [Armatimonadota bacterium]
FGRFLLLAQREKHLTSEEFARKADVDPAELLKIENDPDYAPSPQTVSRIARFLGRPENDLDELARLPASRDDDARQKRTESILHATSGGASRRGG